MTSFVGSFFPKLKLKISAEKLPAITCDNLPMAFAKCSVLENAVGCGFKSPGIWAGPEALAVWLAQCTTKNTKDEEKEQVATMLLYVKKVTP